MIMLSIGSTDSAPKTASVDTGSVAAISEPKIRHSMEDMLIGSKSLSENSPLSATPVAIAEKSEPKMA